MIQYCFYVSAPFLVLSICSAYAKVRETFGPDVWVILDQAGRGLEDFQDQYLEPEYLSLNIDSHLYQVRVSSGAKVPDSQHRLAHVSGQGPFGSQITSLATLNLACTSSGAHHELDYLSLNIDSHMSMVRGP
jgi:hypothetical protein